MDISEPHTALNLLDHPLIHIPATVSLAGLIMWTVVMWGWQRKRYKDGGWWHDYKDEFAASLIGALLFVVYDSQMLHLYNMAAATVLSWLSGPTEAADLGNELTFTHYLCAAGLSERLYTLGNTIYDKIHHKNDSD